MSKFDEVMEQIRARGSENQEKFKKCIYKCTIDTIGIIVSDTKDFSEHIIVVTAEQFLAIYKILGD